MGIVQWVFAALCAAPIVALVVVRVLQKREFGSFFADSRAHVRTVTLPITHREADGLCHRVLRETIGHSESERRGADRFECAGFEFRFVEDGGETTITIRGGGDDGPLYGSLPRDVRAGYERVDRVADRIAAAPLDGPLAEDHPSYRQFGVY